MKKLIIINASPRYNGVNSEVIKQIKPYFAECEIKEYDLYRLSPAPCTACGYCEMHEGCCNSDLNIFFEDYADADYVAFFSPVYNNFFPAPMKAVMDRTQRFLSEKYYKGNKEPIPKRKSGGIVITSGSAARQSSDYMYNTLKQCVKILNTNLKARYYIPNTDSGAYTFNITELEKFVHQIKKKDD